HGTPIALRRADGSVDVNPPMDTVITNTDQIAVIAEDETLIKVTATPTPVNAEHVIAADSLRDPVSRTLLVGWNARGPKIVELLDQVSSPGSVVDIASHREPDEEMRELRINITLGHKVCEPTRRRSLERLGVSAYQHVIVLADDRVGPAQADDRTL